MTRLDDATITEHLDNLSGWKREGNTIRKTFKLHTFPGAIAFVVHVGFLAEAVNHHPAIDIRYNNVTLSLTTHDVGGLTAKDLDLATEIDEFMI